MSPDKQNFPSRMMAVLQALQARIPQPVTARASELKAQFLAAGKSTQYAIGGGAAVFMLLLFTLIGGSSDNGAARITFAVRSGQLDITVLEGGSLEALQSQEIRSRVKGREGVKILNIVEEGYRVTPEDVAAGMILVELDKSQLIDQQLNQEIAVETAEATYIERKAQYEIQLNQNMTDLNDARQDVRFARLDFEKFLGGKIVNAIVTELEIEERLARADAADLAAASAEASNRADAVRRQRNAQTNARGGSGSDPSDLESMPAQMRERIEQMMAENGGDLPAEILERM